MNGFWIGILIGVWLGCAVGAVAIALWHRPGGARTTQ